MWPRASCMASTLADFYATGGLGGGDLKLASVLAATLGWVSWTGPVTGWPIASVAVLAGRAFAVRTLVQTLQRDRKSVV